MMGLGLRSKIVFAIIFALTLCHAQAAQPPTFSGPPSFPAEYLTQESMVAVETKRLATAEIAWLNVDLLKSLQFDVSPEGITKIKKQLLDEYAFIIPEKNLSPDLFTNQTKTFYADRYGGTGTDAFGSGRAAAAGLFQIKGIGRTPLVSTGGNYGAESGAVWTLKHPWKAMKRTLSDRHHSHGGATLREALTEAIWGEILNSELPYGANRIVAVITTSLKIGGEPRALIIRENSLRPAHFIQVKSLNKKKDEAEKNRVVKLNENIQNALPKPDNTTGEVSLREQYLEFTNRVGRTFGAEYAHSVFHGSTSPSNIEIDGKAIDHGPMTSIDGFSNIKFANDFPNGSVRDFEKYIVLEFAAELRETAPEAIIKDKDFPTDDEIKTQLRFSFDDQISRELLWRTGIPAEFISDLVNSGTAKEYMYYLLRVAAIDNDEIYSGRIRIPRNTGRYQVPEILKILPWANLRSENSLNKILFQKIPEDQMREDFVRVYFAVMTEAATLAEKRGVAFQDFKKYVRQASVVRNKKLEYLYRGPRLWISQYFNILKYWFTGDPQIISNYIDTTIQKSQRMGNCTARLGQL